MLCDSVIKIQRSTNLLRERCSVVAGTPGSQIGIISPFQLNVLRGAHLEPFAVPVGRKLHGAMAGQCLSGYEIVPSLTVRCIILDEIVACAAVGSIQLSAEQITAIVFVPKHGIPCAFACGLGH